MQEAGFDCRACGFGYPKLNIFLSYCPGAPQPGLPSFVVVKKCRSAQKAFRPQRRDFFRLRACLGHFMKGPCLRALVRSVLLQTFLCASPELSKTHTSKTSKVLLRDVRVLFRARKRLCESLCCQSLGTLLRARGCSGLGVRGCALVLKVLGIAVTQSCTRFALPSRSLVAIATVVGHVANNVALVLLAYQHCFGHYCMILECLSTLW